MPNSVPNRQSIEDDLLQMIDSDRSFSEQQKADQDALQCNSDSGSFFNNHNFFNNKGDANNFSIFEPSGFGFNQAQAPNQTLDLSNEAPKMTMNATAACFVPKAPVQNSSFDNNSTTSTDNSRGASPSKESRKSSKLAQQERFHAGASKWGKYKKKEKENKRNQQRRRNAVDSDNSSEITSDKDNFDFPDGGWVCGQCQNYNFQGRTKCNRCHKSKAVTDFDGKPKHL